MRQYSSGNGAGITYPTAIVPDQDGNVIVTGREAVDPALPGGVNVTVKYSAIGTPVWTNRNDYVGGACAIDNEGNVIVGGLSGSVKYSASGLLLWTNQLPVSLNYASYQDIKVDSGNGIVISSINSTGTGVGELFLQKYSSSGVLLWALRHPLAGVSHFTGGAVGVALDASEKVFVGMPSDAGNNGHDFLTMSFVPPSALNVGRLPGAIVLSWGNPGSALQAAPSASGTFTNIPGANSPYTNVVSGLQRYFRLAQ